MASNIVVPGTASTPPTITRPGSPQAWRSTARIDRPSRIGVVAVPSLRARPSRSMSAAALRVGELAGDLPSRVAIGDLAASVVSLLAPGQTELDLRSTLAGEVQAERDEREALRSGPAEELVDLGPPEEQLALALRLVVVAVGLL